MSDHTHTDDERAECELCTVRAQLDELQARLDAYEGNVEKWEEIRRLIAASSLGTAEAQAIQARTPAGLGRAMTLGAQYLTRAEQAEAECDRLHATLRYFRALAHLFPHVNTDRDCKTLGIDDDAPGAWCLACSIAATADDVADLDQELLGDDDTDADARARQWIEEYESQERES